MPGLLFLQENLILAYQNCDLPSKRLDFAMHTFATTATLENDVPIKSVSKMLRHAKITPTQIYVPVKERTFILSFYFTNWTAEYGKCNGQLKRKETYLFQ